MFWVISLYFNIRNTLPKSGTFLLGHPVLELVFHIELQWNDDIREDDVDGACDFHRRENK